MALTLWRKRVDRPPTNSAPRKSFQPRLEFLEARCLPAAGSLDPVFGAVGANRFYVPPSQPGQTAAVSAAAVIVANGRTPVAYGPIYAAGTASDSSGSSSFWVVGYTTEGSVQSRATTRFGTNNANSALALAAQADGKILVAGTTAVSAASADAAFALARYSSDLSLDFSFSAGGLVTTDFTSGIDSASGIVVQADGKIVVTGTASGTTSEFALARYHPAFNPEGWLDSSFGTGGKVTTAVGTAATATGVALQADGKIVVIGDSISAGQQRVALVRYNTDGGLDSSFGSNGEVITDFGGANIASSVVVQPDGKLVIAGATGSATNLNFLVARYNANGSLDTSFGTGGKATVDFGGSDTAHSVALQADGKIVVAGTTVLPGGGSHFALARLNTDGSLDTSFGTSGLVTTNFGLDMDAANGGAIQGDGKIVVAGGSSNAAALARYQADGTPSGSPSQRFVSQLYQDLLGRIGDGAGFAYFTGLLDSGQATRSQVVSAFLGSTEYRTHTVRNVYRRFLSRDADSAGLNSFVNVLVNGGMVEQVEALLLGSTEYFTRAGGTNDAFLTALYRDVLGRAVDASGAAGYSFAINHGSSRTDVAGAVLTSGEADVLRVQDFYQRFLNRLPDYGGLVDFEDALLGGARDEAVITAIVASEEYFARL